MTSQLTMLVWTGGTSRPLVQMHLPFDGTAELALWTVLRGKHRSLEVFDSRGRSFDRGRARVEGLAIGSHLRFGAITGIITLLLSFLMLNPILRLSVDLATGRPITVEELRFHLLSLVERRPEGLTHVPLDELASRLRGGRSHRWLLEAFTRD